MPVAREAVRAGTGYKEVVGRGMERISFHSMWEKEEEAWLLLPLRRSKRAEHSRILQHQSRRKFPPEPLSMASILTAEMRPWDHCPSSTALAGMAPTYEGGGEE